MDEPENQPTETESVKKQLPPKSRKIGNFKLLQIIGEGGMGSVYMAEQQHPVRRRVALKVIKGGQDSKNRSSLGLKLNVKHWQ